MRGPDGTTRQRRPEDLIPPDAKKRTGLRDRAGDGGLYAFMRRVLETDAGGELYATLQTMIEPIFADTKFNRRIDRFLRRGRSGARSEWRLTNAAHNLLKPWGTPPPQRPPDGPALAAHNPAARSPRATPISRRRALRLLAWTPKEALTVL